MMRPRLLAACALIALLLPSCGRSPVGGAATDGFTFVSAVLSHDYAGDERKFDVVVANPPYYAGRRISRRFIEIAMAALHPGGAAYFVSKHGPELAEHAEACGFTVEQRKRRGYDIAVCVKAD